MKLTLVLELPEEHLQALLDRAEQRHKIYSLPERQRAFHQDLQETLNRFGRPSEIFNPNEKTPS